MQHTTMVRKQKSLAILSLISGILFLLFSLFHSAILASIALPGHHGSQVSSQLSSTGSCIQQCTVVNSESQLQNEKDEETDPVKPFELLLAAVSIASGLFYLTPHIILLVKRKLKIPIYKQVACFRI